MKKSLLTLGLATLAMTSFAGERILYQQNFETAADPEAAGWTAYRGIISIVSDEYGKFLEVNQNGQNQGTTYGYWGPEIYLDKEGNSVLEDGTYKMHFEFQIKNSDCNQYNSEITVFTNHMPVTNQGYRTPWSPAGYWQNYLFDCSQLDNGTKDALQYVIDGGTVENDGSYSIDWADPNTLAANTWYLVDLDVNVNTREVEYNVQTITYEDVKSGSLTVPETNIADGSDISMYAEGLFLSLARTKTTYDIDNIKIYFDSEHDFANEPTVALTRLGKTEDDELELNLRAYTINFLDGETLHLIGTNGATEEVDWADCDGAYVYETTTSGTLTAWTTCGDAESEKVAVEVDCTPCKLPGVKAAISSVDPGFAKTYTLTVSNTEVPLQPTIFISYEFKGVNGETLSDEDLGSGAKVTVSEEGTLTLTASAFGYESTTVTVKNDTEFGLKKQYDFARMTEEEIMAAGFPEFAILNAESGGGFNSWTSRRYLYYRLEGSMTVNDNGDEVWTNVYPFGWVTNDNEDNVVKYTVINNIDKAGAAGSEEAAENAANVDNVKDEVFKGLTVFPKTGKNSPWKDPYAETEELKQVPHYGTPNVGMLYHVGLFNDQTINNDNTIIVHDLAASDIVVVNKISGYGGNVNHPVCATNEEYYEQIAGDDTIYSVAADGATNEETGEISLSFPLYRIDTALTYIKVYAPVGGDAVDAVEAVVAGDNYWYSIDGVRVAQPTRPGLYIHNGKKIIIK